MADEIRKAMGACSWLFCFSTPGVLPPVGPGEIEDPMLRLDYGDRISGKRLKRPDNT
jgi:hypothetical protein